jgi:hypothetical protein
MLLALLTLLALIVVLIIIIKMGMERREGSGDDLFLGQIKTTCISFLFDTDWVVS